jgi:pimeloyl-ACP methyl ester carboxylesterase
MRRFKIAFAEGETTGVRFGGDGPPDLVFLHATGFNALTYRPILAAVGQHFRVVAIDQRGHGRCPLAAEPERFRDWTDYVDDFVTVGARLWGSAPPPVLAGHSMGGSVALMAAARRPDLADRLVLLDPVMVPSRLRLLTLWLTPLDARIRRMPIARAAARRRRHFGSRTEMLDSYRGRGAFATWKPGFLEAYVDGGTMDMADGGVALTCAPRWEATTFATQRSDIAAAFGRAKCPALLMCGSRQSATRVSAERLASLKRDLRIETVPETTHFVPMEEPELVRDRLLQALEERAAGLATSDRPDLPSPRQAALSAARDS